MKNKIILTLCFFLTAISLSNLCFADNWFEGLIVSQIQTFPDDGKFAIYVDTGLDSACSGGKAVYVESGKAGMTNAGVKNALSVALSALMSGNNLNISVPTVESPCYVDRLRIEKK